MFHTLNISSKKVDRLIGLGEVDRGYILSFLRDEFPHWYNSYFFPATLADIARQSEGEAEQHNIPTDMLLSLKEASEGSASFDDKTISLPLQPVDYIAAFGAADRPETKYAKTRQVATFAEHLEQLVKVGILTRTSFRRSAAWEQWEHKAKPNYLLFYEGDALPFPELRKLIRKGR